MSEYLSKKAVLESIDAEQIRLMGEHQSVTGYHKRYVTGKYDGLNWIKHQIQSGAFDAPDGEVQHLRAALEEVRECLDDFWDRDTPRRLYKEVRRFVGQIHVMEKVINQALSTTSEPTGTQLADEQGYHEWVLGGLINATNEIQRLRSVFSSRGVFNALRYYQKQGLCEGNEYEEIENALEALSAKTSTGEQREIEQEE